MSGELKSIQPSETRIRLELDSDCPDLDHVETFNVSAEAQAAIDREYIKFLEAKNARLENLCTRATTWLSLVAISLIRERKNYVVNTTPSGPLRGELNIPSLWRV
jgi:hypothetical protein